MRYNQSSISFTSAICWLSFWIGSVLIGASWLYARLQGKEFISGLSNGWINVTSPDSTVALMLSLGILLIIMGLLFVPLYYSAIFVSALAKILTRKPIRV